MTSKFLALSGAALALLMVSSFTVPADARGGGGGGGHGGGGGGGHGFGGGGHAFGGGGPVFGGGPMGGAHMGGPHMGGMGARGFVGSPRFDHRGEFRHRRVFVGAPFFFDGGYYDGYYYGNGCYWLRRNAVYSGSPYWWNRYYACANGYGY